MSEDTPARTQVPPTEQVPADGAPSSDDASRPIRDGTPVESGTSASLRRESREPVKVLYIAGIGRSGSTLLARALGAADGLVAAGEVMHFFGRGLVNNELCACGRPVRECPLWGRVADGLRDGNGPIPSARVERLRHRLTEGRHLPALFSPVRTPRLEEKLDRYRERLDRLYRELRRRAGARAVVDSSKNAGYARILRDTPGVELHLVHLVRDSRGVAHSLAKEKERPGVPWDGGQELLDQRGPGSASVFWMAAQLMVESLRKDAASYRCVRYRDFVRDPAGSLRSSLRSAGEFGDVDQLAHVKRGEVELEPQHILAGNPMRSRQGTIVLEEDLAWRDEMGAGVRSLVTTLTWPLLRRYGYLEPGFSGDRGAPVADPEPSRTRPPGRARAREGRSR